MLFVIAVASTMSQVLAAEVTASVTIKFQAVASAAQWELPSSCQKRETFEVFDGVRVPLRLVECQ
jgi:hypothetical protein